MAGSYKLIKRAEINNSVANVTITDCFTSDYDIYVISAWGIATGDADGKVELLDSSGNVIQVSDYDFAMDVMKSNSGFTDYKDTAQSSWLATFSFSDKGSGNIIHIYRPYATSYTFYTGQRTGLSGGNLRGYKANGVYKNQTSTTGLKIIFDSNVTFGKFSVYGVI